jgi:hypothetical protein
MAGSEGSASSHRNEGAYTVLRVLEKKAYFKHRFLEQVLALYQSNSETPSAFPTLPASLYLGSLFNRIPEHLRVKVGNIAAKHVVDDFDGCPTPVEVRAVIAQATLESMSLSYESLAERAKLFLACPPTDQEIASRWPEQVLYSTILRIGRDRFTSIAPDDWKREVSQTVFGDGEVLKPYRVPVTTPVQSERRDFRGLLSAHE